jgi:Tfp pilus assembly protein PilF/class 3 adenylate cyclase
MTYLAAIFTDLERHSVVWTRTPRDQMAAIIAEYRYLAESLGSSYDAKHRNFTGDGHLFLYETADAAVRFGLDLLSGWGRFRADRLPAADAASLTLRVGCHFGECMEMPGGTDWIGRAIILAKRVEGCAAQDDLYVTESVLELIDLPMYDFEEAGRHELKGDHLPSRTLYRIASFSTAAIDARPSAQLSAEDWFLKAVAIARSEHGNDEEERQCYDKALALRPDYAAAHNNLAVVLRKTGDATAAAEHYREALRLQPNNPEAHYNYAILLEDLGSDAGAAEHLREAIALRPEFVDAHHRYANLLARQGDAAGAVQHYESALETRPGHAEVHNNYAILLEDVGEKDAALAHYRAAIEARPDYAEAHYNLAILHEDRDEPGHAERHYREAIRLWPEYGEAHNNLAVLLHASNTDDAELHYREALRIRPNDPETHHNYALFLRARGDVAGAEKHARIAADVAPGGDSFRTATEHPG